MNKYFEDYNMALEETDMYEEDMSKHFDHYFDFEGFKQDYGMSFEEFFFINKFGYDS